MCVTWGSWCHPTLIVFILTETYKQFASIGGGNFSLQYHLILPGAHSELSRKLVLIFQQHSNTYSRHISQLYTVL